jgi:aminobenzoyl-glutamate transport protein
VIEPRLRSVPVDGDADEMPKMETLGVRERRGMWAGLAALTVGIAILVFASAPLNSIFRAPNGSLTHQRRR